MAFIAVLAVLESTLPLICLSCKIQAKEAIAVSEVVAVSVMTATPPKLNPPFPIP